MYVHFDISVCCPNVYLMCRKSLQTSVNEDGKDKDVSFANREEEQVGSVWLGRCAVCVSVWLGKCTVSLPVWLERCTVSVPVWLGRCTVSVPVSLGRCTVSVHVWLGRCTIL